MKSSRFPKKCEAFNVGVDNVFNPIETIDSLFDVPNIVDLSSIYRGQVYWSTIETDVIVNKIKDYFKLMPSAKASAFHLISTMVHEDMNFAFLEKDGKISGLKTVKYYKLHDALESIYAFMFELFEVAGSRVLFNDSLNWAINLCADVVYWNLKRLKPTRTSPIIENLKKIESGSRLLQFIDKLFTLMLKNYANDAFFALVRYSEVNLPAEERRFDWLIIFFFAQFSSTVIQRMIKYGGEKLRRICKDNTDVVQANAVFNDLYNPLITLMFVVQKSRQLETNVAVEHIYEDYINGKAEDNFDIIFLLKVCYKSPLFFDGVLSHLMPLLTQQSLIRLCSVVKDPHFPLVRDAPPLFFDSLKAAIFRASPLKTFEYLETLQIMAFNPSILENSSDLGTSEQNMVRECLKIACLEILNNFIKFIHENKRITLNEVPKFAELQTDDDMLKRLIIQCLELNEFGQQRCKLLHCICVIADITFTRRVFAIFLYAAQSLSQLTQFTVFAATVILYYPTAMLEALKELVKKTNEFMIMFRDETLKFHVFSNITSLLRWADENQGSKSQLSMFGLKYNQIVDTISMAELAGLLVKFALSSLQSYLMGIEVMDDQVFDNFLIVVEFVLEVKGAAPIEPGICFAISNLISSIYVLCLRYIDANSSTGHGEASIMKLTVVMKHILSQRWDFPKNFLVATYVREVLIASSMLFGKKIDLTGIKQPYDDEEDDLDGSLFAEYKDTSVRTERARELIQSGSIKKLKKLTHGSPQLSSESLRSYYFIYTLDFLLTRFGEKLDGKKEQVRDVLAIREVANAFNDVVFSDKNHSSYYRMSDWYEERNSIGDYVDVAAKIEAIPVSYHIMAIISEAPYPSFFCLAPSITALLADVVNQCELQILKDSRVLPNAFTKIERLLSLIAKAGILTSLMLLLLEMIRRCTMHEASSLLIELWRILTYVRPIDEKPLNDMMIELNIRQHESPRGIIEMPECPSLQLLKLMNIVVMRDPHRMSDLGAKIITLFPKDIDEDEWESGPLFPVISFNEPLRRV